MIKRWARGGGAAAVDVLPHVPGGLGSRAYLSNGGTLEHAQQIAGHASSPKTTKLYDRPGGHGDGRRHRAHRDLSGSGPGDNPSAAVGVPVPG